MKRHLLALAFVVSLFAASTAHADSWMFQPSYYTHNPVTQVRIGRQYSEGPVFTRPQGEFVRSGYRYNRSVISIKGQTWDNVNNFEGWYQVGAQY